MFKETWILVLAAARSFHRAHYPSRGERATGKRYLHTVHRRDHPDPICQLIRQPNLDVITEVVYLNGNKGNQTESIYPRAAKGNPRPEQRNQRRT